MINGFFCAKDIYKEYKIEWGSIHVLNGINMTVEKGEVVIILGVSGAGKSTLLHILGLLDRPTSGAVFYKGVNLNELDAKEQAVKRNQIFGFVFQFYHLLPDFSTLENVMMPGLIGQGLSRKNINKKTYMEKAKALLDQVGLGKRINHRPDQLSGGERQRVAITRALINDPEILLCDEPTGNLDSKTGVEVLRLIWDINNKFGQTVIMVTHDEHLVGHANRVIRMVDGAIVD